MPVWGQVVLGVAAVVGAVLYLWQKVLKPGAQLIYTMDRLLPVAKELTEQFHDAPEAFAILRDIAHEFKPNSGTSLHDVINRLDVTSKVLQQNAEVERRLAAQDRAQLAELIAKLDKANAGIAAAAEGAAGIATDLDAAHTRAEEHDETSAPGEASDAAMRRPSE